MASWGRRYYFFLGGGYILLPVEFCCLTATIFNRSGHISWQTKSEINNAGFEVQKSMDGISWDSLGFAQGAGSSSLTLDYEFVDENLALGNNYYRIVQSDFDKVETVFDPILLVNGDPPLKKDLFVFPNPATEGQLVIYFAGLGFDVIKFNLFSTSGEIVISALVPNFNGEYCIVQLPPRLSTGVYYVQVGNFIERVLVK